MFPGVVAGKTHATQNVKKEKSSLEDTESIRTSLDVEEAPGSIGDEENNQIISATPPVYTDEINEDTSNTDGEPNQEMPRSLAKALNEFFYSPIEKEDTGSQNVNLDNELTESSSFC